MNTQHKNSATSRQHTNEPTATMTEPTIQQQPAGSSETKELRSHQCITIKWSLDSDCRRSVDVPPVAAVGVVASGSAEAGGGSC